MKLPDEYSMPREEALPPSQEYHMPREPEGPAVEYSPPRTEETPPGSEYPDPRRETPPPEAPKKRRTRLLYMALAALVTVNAASIDSSLFSSFHVSTPEPPPAYEHDPWEYDPGAYEYDPGAYEYDPDAYGPSYWCGQILTAENAWVADDGALWLHFDDDGTAWTYDGTYYQFLTWYEDGYGGVYWAGSFLRPALQDWTDGADMSVISSTGLSGAIADLLPNETGWTLTLYLPAPYDRETAFTPWTGSPLSLPDHVEQVRREGFLSTLENSSWVFRDYSRLLPSQGGTAAFWDSLTVRDGQFSSLWGMYLPDGVFDTLTVTGTVEEMSSIPRVFLLTPGRDYTLSCRIGNSTTQFFLSADAGVRAHLLLSDQGVRLAVQCDPNLYVNGSNYVLLEPVPPDAVPAPEPPATVTPIPTETLPPVTG